MEYIMHQSCVILFYWFFVSNACIASQQLTFSTGEKFPMTPVASAVLATAYQKLGIQLMIKKFPIRRSLMLANTGATDGELFRGKIDSKHYPNLIKIPVSLATGRLMIFTKSANLQVDGWESLIDYRVGCHTDINEVKIHKNEFKSFKEMASNMRLFNMLARDRLDILILPYLVGVNELKKLNRSDIKMLSTPLEANKLYHYLHIKHRKLVPKITQVLQQMHDSGELGLIRKKIKISY